MRVFVFEYITSGALAAESLPDSLLREGETMLSAMVADLTALPSIQVAISVDHRLGEGTRPTLQVDRIENIDDVEVESSVFEDLVRWSDVTLVIAPETDGVLRRRVQRVIDLGRRCVNCLPRAIDLCGDKWQLFQHLQRHGLPTIPTQFVDWDASYPWRSFGTSCVVKPLDGAGSWLTYHIPIDDRDGWQFAKQQYLQAGITGRALLQPFVSGVSISAACLSHGNGSIEIFPIARQKIDAESFRYRGGTIPLRLDDHSRSAIERLIETTCATIPGLYGYIGFDLILPDADPTLPIITEINPRLTTSYAGYRLLCSDNIAERLIANDVATSPLRWKNANVVDFDV
jgi:predicted ATP-grasp superfamily ATP-dependent carboligase